VIAETFSSYKQKMHKNHHIVMYFLFCMIVFGVVATNRFDSKTLQTSSVAGQFSSEYLPSDALTSAQAASAVALATDMIVAEQVVETAVQQDAKVDIPVLSEDYISKPLSSATEAKTKDDITKHVVAKGETIKSIAEDNNIRVSTIVQVNNLPSEDVAEGKEITIPPVDGLLHTVKEGETVDSLAQTYQAEADRISSFNDAEITGLIVGQQIIIPDGKQPVAAPVRTSRSSGLGVGYGLNNTRSASSVPLYVGNRYAYGHCTWYVSNLRAAAGKPIPSFWGNAGAWGSRARQDGYTVSSVPVVGSIAWRTGGYGHVAYVTAVNGDTIHVKEMHGFRANGVPMEADYSVSSFNGYIY
jgi:surface antigen